MRPAFMTIAVLATLALAALWLAPVRAQAPGGIPPVVSVFAQDAGGRTLRITVNNPTRSLTSQHYSVNDPHTDPASTPRQTCDWPQRAGLDYRGGAVECVHFFQTQEPTDVYYVVERGLGVFPRRWGPYTLTQPPAPGQVVRLAGPETHLVRLPLLQH